jgi:hypothetical protein
MTGSGTSIVTTAALLGIVASRHRRDVLVVPPSALAVRASR